VSESRRVRTIEFRTVKTAVSQFIRVANDTGEDIVSLSLECEDKDGKMVKAKLIFAAGDVAADAMGHAIRMIDSIRGRVHGTPVT